MTQSAPAVPADKVAAYAAETQQALSFAQQQMAEKQAAEQALAANAPALAQALLDAGLIAPSQKQAALAQLADPVALQTILNNVISRQKAASAVVAPAVPAVGRGLPEKAASAYGVGGYADADHGRAKGTLTDPIVCGHGRSLNDPDVRRRSSALLKLAGIQ
jgi:hypothetical protein